MFELNDNVIIKEKNIEGTIVDVTAINDDTVYVVESNVPDIHDGYGGKWKVFDCKENEIDKI